MELLTGKTAVVTGATRGIGKAIAFRLAALGANVTVNGYQAALVSAVESEMKQQGMNVLGFAADVASKEQVERMMEATAATFGGIDILIANAGVTDIGPIEEISEERWDRIMNINAKGVFLTCQAVLPYMRKRGGGSIVTIGSDAALEGMKYLVPYSASKFAVRGITQALAKEVGKDGIRVNCICPGIIDTDMWEVTDRDLGKILGLKKGETFNLYSSNALLGRAGVPDDIADVAAFLVSDQAKYMTGTSIPVGGGTSLN